LGMACGTWVQFNDFINLRLRGAEIKTRKVLRKRSSNDVLHFGKAREAESARQAQKERELLTPRKSLAHAKETKTKIRADSQVKNGAAEEKEEEKARGS